MIVNNIYICNKFYYNDYENNCVCVLFAFFFD